jgi:hypothetical protein
MSSKYRLSLAQLDAFLQATKAYLDATVTKCDSPEIRAARSALIKTSIPVEVECHVAKMSVDIAITTSETVV